MAPDHEAEIALIAISRMQRQTLDHHHHRSHAMNHFNVLVLVHAAGDTTIADMVAIDAYAITGTTESAQEVQDRLEAAAYEQYGRSVSIYLQPYRKD